MSLVSLRTDPRSAADPIVRLVVLPSLGTTTRIWDGAVDALMERLPGVSVMRGELPGHGGAPVPDRDFAIEDMTDDVMLAVSSTGVAPPLVVAGASLGGSIALDAARRYPTRVTAFAMFNSRARFNDTDGWASLIGKVRRNGTGSLRAESATGWFSPGFSTTSHAVVGRILSELAGVQDRGYIKCCEALAVFDAASDLGSITARGLTVAGSRDRGPTAAEVEELSRALPDAGYRVLEGGHLAIVEQPVAAGDLLADLVNSVLPSARATA